MERPRIGAIVKSFFEFTPKARPSTPVPPLGRQSTRKEFVRNAFFLTGAAASAAAACAGPQVVTPEPTKPPIIIGGENGQSTTQLQTAAAQNPPPTAGQGLEPAAAPSPEIPVDPSNMITEEDIFSIFRNTGGGAIGANIVSVPTPDATKSKIVNEQKSTNDPAALGTLIEYYRETKRPESLIKDPVVGIKHMMALMQNMGIVGQYGFGGVETPKINPLRFSLTEGIPKAGIQIADGYPPGLHLNTRTNMIIFGQAVFDAKANTKGPAEPVLLVGFDDYTRNQDNSPRMALAAIALTPDIVNLLNGNKNGIAVTTQADQYSIQMNGKVIETLTVGTKLTQKYLVACGSRYINQIIKDPASKEIKAHPYPVVPLYDKGEAVGYRPSSDGQTVTAYDKDNKPIAIAHYMPQAGTKYPDIPPWRWRPFEWYDNTDLAERKKGAQAWVDKMTFEDFNDEDLLGLKRALVEFLPHMYNIPTDHVFSWTNFDNLPFPIEMRNVLKYLENIAIIRGVTDGTRLSATYPDPLKYIIKLQLGQFPKHGLWPGAVCAIMKESCVAAILAELRLRTKDVRKREDVWFATPLPGSLNDKTVFSGVDDATVAAEVAARQAIIDAVGKKQIQLDPNELAMIRTANADRIIQLNDTSKNNFGQRINWVSI